MPNGPVPFVFGAQLLLALPVAFFVWRIMSTRRARDQAALTAGPTTDPTGMTAFPIRGASTRGGFLRNSYSQNSINPRFQIAHDAVLIRIFKEWRLPFADLTQIDARKTVGGGMALIFQIKADNRVVIARFGDPDLARSALALVPASVPLTEDAALLRDGHTRAATPGLARYTGRLG